MFGNNKKELQNTREELIKNLMKNNTLEKENKDIKETSFEFQKKIAELDKNKNEIKKNIQNLYEYLDEDDIYKNYKQNNNTQDYNDFEMFCINHCRDIENVLKLIERIDYEL